MTQPLMVMNPEAHDPNGPTFWKTVEAAKGHARNAVATRTSPYAQVWLSRIDGRDVVHSVVQETQKLFMEVTKGRMTKLLTGFIWLDDGLHECAPAHENKDWAVRW